MYDTIRIKSPYILNNAVVNRIRKFCMLRQGISFMDGSLLYEITTGELRGTWDSRISLNVKNKEWVNEGGKTVLRDTFNYIELEASIHKLMLGHNVYGGPDNIKLSIKWLINFIEKIIGIKLPDFEEWHVKRIDIAYAFDLGSLTAVREWFRGINTCIFPRRQVLRFGETGIYIPGVEYTNKFYSKGVEFRKHDMQKIKNHMKMPKQKQYLEKLQRRADNILRSEMEVKSRMINKVFASDMVKDINDELLIMLYERSVSKFMRVCNEDKGYKIVNRSEDVSKRLNDIYGSRLSGILLGLWYQLTTLGEQYVKDNMTKATYYRNIKYLKDAKISWLNTDIVKIDRLVPEDFLPLPTNGLVINSVSNKVKYLLEEVA